MFKRLTVCLLYNGYQMMNLAYHTTERGSVLTLYHLRDSVQTERLKSTLLVDWSTDLALYLLDFQCCHTKNLLSFIR